MPKPMTNGELGAIAEKIAQAGCLCAAEECVGCWPDVTERVLKALLLERELVRDRLAHIHAKMRSREEHDWQREEWARMRGESDALCWVLGRAGVSCDV